MTSLFYPIPVLRSPETFSQGEDVLIIFRIEEKGHELAVILQ